MPLGREDKIHGLDTYIAEPKSSPAKGIVVIIPDAFGWQFVNNRILADHYASRGNFKVYLPDFMHGKFSRSITRKAPMPCCSSMLR
jgi:dienelactone hydrolase